MTSRRLSLIIALLQTGGAGYAGGAEGALKCLTFFILPLGCIWYSDELGSFTGIMRGQSIDCETPGWLVAAAGWLLLFVPVLIGTIRYATS